MEMAVKTRDDGMKVPTACRHTLCMQLHLYSTPGKMRPSLWVDETRRHFADNQQQAKNSWRRKDVESCKMLSRCSWSRLSATKLVNVAGGLSWLRAIGSKRNEASFERSSKIRKQNYYVSRLPCV